MEIRAYPNINCLALFQYRDSG